MVTFQGGVLRSRVKCIAKPNGVGIRSCRRLSLPRWTLTTTPRTKLGVYWDNLRNNTWVANVLAEFPGAGRTPGRQVRVGGLLLSVLVIERERSYQPVGRWAARCPGARAVTKRPRPGICAAIRITPEITVVGERVSTPTAIAVVRRRGAPTQDVDGVPTCVVAVLNPIRHDGLRDTGLGCLGLTCSDGEVWFPCDGQGEDRQCYY